MKNHKRFAELIQGYLDDTLSGKERRDLENHLKSCKNCREELKSREGLLQKLRSIREEIQCPDYLIDNILKNTTQKETPVIISSYKIRWRYLAVSAAAILIVISTVLLNIEDVNRMSTTKKPEGFLMKEALEGEKIREETEGAPAKRKAEEIVEEKYLLESDAEEVEVSKVPLPEKKVGFVATERAKEVTSSEGLAEVDVIEEFKDGAPMFSKAAKAPPSAAIKGDQIREGRTFELAADMEMESISSKVLEHSIRGEGISIRFFEETRFVFPEEGSVVGEDFEIVLILENPEEAIEITLDGEKIVNYTIEKDSNIIFIGSDSIPPLEEGLHYLSLKTKGEKSITFYKEG